MPLFADNIIIYIEITKEFTIKATEVNKGIEQGYRI